MSSMEAGGTFHTSTQLVLYFKFCILITSIKYQWLNQQREKECKIIQLCSKIVKNVKNFYHFKFFL